MSNKNVSPLVKTALEMGPVILFFVAFVLLKDREFIVAGTAYKGFIAATALFIPVLLISTGILWKLTGELSKMQIVTAVLVLVFGGLGIWFNDERFFKMKPTLIYLIFGGLLGFGLLRGQSYLKVVMEQALPMVDAGWMILTKRMTAFFFALAIANEVVWRTMSTEAWVNFKTFGLTAALFIFMMTQSGLLAKYGIAQDDDTDAA
ncbi:putative intracellular septation protein A [Amylibacter ulvae]|uniref:Inner membrane-spanning protein YciB n=1 Tax=Paramylibacter ulvae TaxID=1651968 RepID=A0ABQ3D7S8_9RHOB|nr:inner membrane-spanning protein YciB [Amylibacter ulvae]GHA55067.1 putative intracellular septation protein A [Amylibacter ulvae]